MADIRIKDLPTTASQTASDDFIALDGTVNGTRKIDASAPSFKTSVTSPSVAAPAATNLTLAGGSSGASLVLGQGATGTPRFNLPSSGSLLLYSSVSSGTSDLNFSNPVIGSASTSAAARIRSTITASGADQDLSIWTMSSGVLNRALTVTQGTGGAAGNLLIGTTTDISGSGGLHVAGTGTATSSSNGGALRVGTNVAMSGNAGGASYFGGAVTVTGNAYTNGVNADTFDTNAGSSIASFVGIKGSSASSNTSGIAISNAGLLGFARNAASKDIVSAYLIPSLTVTTSGAEVGRLDINVKPSGNSAYNTNVIRLGGDLSATFAGAVAVSSSTASTNTTSGALVVTGGVGVGGAINAGGNLTSPDLILGTSGPSAKSSIAARAARQGLVFDGTGAATVTLPVIGTGDFAVGAWVKPVAGATSVIFWGANNSLGLAVRATTITIDQPGVGTPLSVAYTASGRWIFVLATRSGTTATIYVDGVLIGSGTVSTNFSAATSQLALSTFPIVIGQPVYLNRALSAAEVVSLYESGVPAGADYNTASNTALSLGNFANSGYDTFTGASATGFTAINTSVDGYAYTTNQFTLIKGARYQMTFTCTLTSGQVPVAYLGVPGSSVLSVQTRIAAGANVLEFTATASGASNGVFYSFNGEAVSYAISNFALTRLGLLLAPDAAQSGGGLTWYDTSGNAANITLPATGVTWNVPTSGKAFSLSLASTTSSTNTTSGAFVVTGGVGVGGALNVGGAVAIGNTVNTVSPTSPNRTVTMVIGGVTYYLAAKTTND